MLSIVLFYLFAVLIIGSALMMVISTNIVHSALWMVSTFVGVACIYVMLYADFLALVQLLVYVGAISVLMVFGVMLTRRGNINESNLFNRYKIVGGIVVFGLFLVMERFILNTKWVISNVNPVQTTVPQLADLMLKDYVVPFEVAAILLLIAMVGAIIIGKGVSDSQ